MDKLKDIGRIIRGWMQSKNGLVWGVISVSVLIIASVISLIISVYTKDEPKIIPQETRGAVREGVKEGVAEPVAKIAPQIGQAIINAAYKDSPSGTDLKPTGPAGSNGAPAVDTSNWSVYRDEKLGFEIRYPEGYTVKNNNNVTSIASMTSTGVGIWIYKYETDEDANVWWANVKNSFGATFRDENITINKLQFIKSSTEESFAEKHYILKRENNLIEIISIGYGKNEQIINTFSY